MQKLTEDFSNEHNTTTKEQLADLKREFAHLMIGDMSPKELFEFAIHRVTCDVALMRQEELKEHIDEYDEYAYEVLEDYVTDTVGSYEIYQEFLSDRNSTWERD